MKKILLFLVSIFGLNLMFVGTAKAICPVCTVFVGAGVGLSRWLGIDDTITGIWVGGLTVSLIIWTINWFNKKNIRFKGRKILIVLGYYALIVAPLHFTNIIGHPQNTLWGMDRLLLGIGVGTLVFIAANWWYESIKKKNNGKAQFPFQKVVWPVGALAIASAIFYLLTM
jgi:hypothetical protein